MIYQGKDRELDAAAEEVHSLHQTIASLRNSLEDIGAELGARTHQLEIELVVRIALCAFMSEH